MNSISHPASITPPDHKATYLLPGGQIPSADATVLRPRPHGRNSERMSQGGIKQLAMPRTASSKQLTRLNRKVLNKSNHFPFSTQSRNSPERKWITGVQGWVLIVNEIEPAILKRTAVGFDLSESERIKRASVFRTDLNDHLILITSFFDRDHFCGKRGHL
jgi:hypothetical protein